MASRTIGAKILFSVESPRNAPSYYLLLNKTKLVGIGAERPWIKPETLGDRSLVYYDARDGLKIPAFLTLPPGFKKGDPAPPAIVLPHGGPWARDFIGWDATGWTQFLATRGYAVLQPQYRGSDGWGHNLWLAGDGEWGLKMQDDKDDGANWMVKEGYASKDRIAIFGYSYGGFAAFAASVRPGGPFKCAIAGAGVSNLTRIANNWGENRLQRAYQGRTVKGMDPQQNTVQARDADPDLSRRPRRARAAVPRHRLLQLGEVDRQSQADDPARTWATSSTSGRPEPRELAQRDRGLPAPTTARSRIGAVD